MQSSPRIEELRQKFHENPRRYFAPLANEYRKAGDPEQAIAICRAHLAQQPGHMSGHVVYGQALYDARRMDEASAVFQRALALDPENIIVLRHLGDIARQRGDVEEARSWYSRTLDGDPHDAETAAYLAELTEPLATAPAAESEAEPSEPKAPEPETVAPEVASPEAEAVSPVAATPDAGPTEAEAAVALAAELEMDTADQDLPRAEPLVSPYAREIEISAPAEMKWDLSDSPYLELVESATSGEGSDSAPEASEALQPAVEEQETVESPPPAEDETQRPSRRTPTRATTPVSESAPIVTRTLAELYLEQGYIEPALEIYRQLAEREPDDSGIQARIDELTSEGEAPSEPPATEPDEHFWDSADAWGDRPFIDSDDRDEIFGLAEDIEQSGLTAERGAETPLPPPEPIPATEPEPEPEPSPDVRERTSITVREFFATLGSVRPPPGEQDQKLATDEQIQELGAGGSSDASGAQEADSIADDAFANLFAGVPVDAEDSRAAAALSGAVAHGAPFSTPLPTAPPAPSRDVQPAQTSGGPAQESEEDIRRFREWLDGLAES